MFIRPTLALGRKEKKRRRELWHGSFGRKSATEDDASVTVKTLRIVKRVSHIGSLNMKQWSDGPRELDALQLMKLRKHQCNCISVNFCNWLSHKWVPHFFCVPLETLFMVPRLVAFICSKCICQRGECFPWFARVFVLVDPLAQMYF